MWFGSQHAAQKYGTESKEQVHIPSAEAGASADAVLGTTK